MKKNKKQCHLDDKLKSEKDANIAIDFSCSNSRIINELQASFGKLFRVSTMRSVIWTNKLPKEMCHLVHAYSCPTQKLRRILDDQETIHQMSDHIENDVLQQSCN